MRKNLPKKRFDIQIIAHSVLQKQYIQIRGLSVSQNRQQRSRHNSLTPGRLFPLHPMGDRHKEGSKISPTTEWGQA
ncbi:MAG: hypothetical protein M3O33_22500 [Cyanobacteriota bacterium]|nr:hypothetical protein [Cyanobacteriota bacterium]